MSIQKRTTKNGTSYTATVYLKHGKTMSKTFSRKLDAESWQVEHRKLVKGNANHSLAHKTFFMKYAHEWLENHGSINLQPSTKRRYTNLLKYQIEPWFKDCVLSEITHIQVENWKYELAKLNHVGAKTINHALALIKVVYKHAVENEYLPTNKLERVKPLKIPKKEMGFLTDDETKRFLTHIWQHEPKYYLLYFIAFNTGLRLGEIIALKWDVINFDQGIITVKRTYCSTTKTIKETTKTNHIRHVPINKSLRKLLLERKLSSESETVVDYFVYEKIAEKTHRFCRESQVRGINFHGTRHTFASNFMMAGGDIYDLQKILGHTTITTTERYSHLSPEHLNGATDYLDLDVRQAAQVFAINTLTKP